MSRRLSAVNVGSSEKQCYFYFITGLCLVVMMDDGLTRPFLEMVARINSVESQRSGNPPGTRPKIQNKKGVAEDGQMHRVKCRAV